MVTEPLHSPGHPCLLRQGWFCPSKKKKSEKKTFYLYFCLVLLVSNKWLFKILTLNRKGFVAIALFPILITSLPKKEVSPELINHENIHFKQQLECLLIGFYFIYIGEFLFYMLRFKNWDRAYKYISFEKEAYENETNLDYLRTRKSFAQWRKNAKHRN